jgi:hypothetical protein
MGFRIGAEKLGNENRGFEEEWIINMTVTGALSPSGNTVDTIDNYGSYLLNPIISVNNTVDTIDPYGSYLTGVLGINTGVST